MTTDERDELSIRAAAEACNVSDKTIRRNLQCFPGAYRLDTKSGKAKGEWRIPRRDLVAARYLVSSTSDRRSGAMPNVRALEQRVDELATENAMLRELLAEVRVRADLAEALADERRVMLELLRSPAGPPDASSKLTPARKVVLPPGNPANPYFDALRQGRSEPELPFVDQE